MENFDPLVLQEEVKYISIIKEKQKQLFIHPNLWGSRVGMIVSNKRERISYPGEIEIKKLYE